MVCHCRFIRNHSVCLHYSSKHHFVRCSKLGSYIKNLVNKVVCDPLNRECMMHHCTNCPGTKALCKFLEEELSDIDPDFQFHYSQRQTIGRASLVTATWNCEENKDNLMSAINAITKHSVLAKCQANFLSQEIIPESKWSQCSWAFRW